jgi:hypothetical protein
MLNTEWFIEVSDGVKRKSPPEMIKTSELQKWQAEHQLSTNGLFSSVYCYPTDDPYVGGVISDFYMDFDCEENPDKAKRELVAVIKKLGDYGISEDMVSICFSGKKGFSLTIDHKVFNAESSAYLPLIWKSIVQGLIDQLKLTTVDLVVYQRRQLWRRPNSKHQKTGLYKTPIFPKELEEMSIEQIKELAIHPRGPFVVSEAQVVPKAEKLFQEHKQKVEAWLNERKTTFRTNQIEAGAEDPPCIQKLLLSGAKIGSRNSSMFQLAIYFAQKGLTSNQIEDFCYTFAGHCERTIEDFPRSGEVKSVVESAMRGVNQSKNSVGCSSEAFVDFCDKDNCPVFHKQETKENKCSCGDDLSDKVFEQIENQQFLVYDKETGEETRQKTIDGTKPLNQLLWNPVNETLDFGSEQELFDEIRKYLYEFIDIAEGYDVLTAWVLSSWIPEKWHAVPYLSFFGPPGSGKTWALEVLASIGFRPFLSASATLASVF